MARRGLAHAPFLFAKYLGFFFSFRRKYEKLHFYMLLSLHALPSSSMNILQTAYNDYYLQIM